MISSETLEKLSRQYQTDISPNIVREYFQHIFLGELYSPLWGLMPSALADSLV